MGIYQTQDHAVHVGIRRSRQIGRTDNCLLYTSRTPIERFDVQGPFDFAEQIPAPDEMHRIAMEERPDLKAAVQTVEKAQTDYKLAVANGSTDPTFGVDFGRNPPIPVYMGVSVNIPLRIFDRNQGEKARTQVDITRTERLRDAAEAQVFSDVDSAYATLASTVTLLRPYKAKYLATASRIRDTIAFSYQHGQAALVDYLDAQRDYRAVQVSYLNPVSYTHLDVYKRQLQVCADWRGTLGVARRMSSCPTGRIFL